MAADNRAVDLGANNVGLSRGAVLHLGRLAMTAPKAELERSPEIARLYLGAD